MLIATCVVPGPCNVSDHTLLTLGDCALQFIRSRTHGDIQKDAEAVGRLTHILGSTAGPEVTAWRRDFSLWGPANYHQESEELPVEKEQVPPAPSPMNYKRNEG